MIAVSGGMTSAVALAVQHSIMWPAAAQVQSPMVSFPIIPQSGSRTGAPAGAPVTLIE